ncbi:MAG: CpXC domain-containing protein [Anaerolineales bacterium]
MSPARTQVRCPNCQSPIQAEIDQIVDVAEDPSAKSRLLSGSLNHIRCPNCGYQGQLATPLVYHDPEKELLLTYMPPEVGMNKDDQERAVGRLINQIVDRLPQEQRKAYLLQPTSALTLQGLIEQVLAADGITKEDIEAQQAKLRLFEQLINTPEDDLEAFVQEHDEELDQAFFQLASMALQSIDDERVVNAAAQRLDRAVRLSSVGADIQAQEEEIQAAAEQLRELGEGLTRESLLDLLVNAPSEDRVSALVNLTRPALDYTFFQRLSERIDGAEGEEAERLTALRELILEITQAIDQAQQARAEQTANLLKMLIQADDLDEALQAVLPAVDDMFLGTLQANLAAARERGNQEAVQRLEAIESRLTELIQSSLPPSLALAQEILDTEDIEKAKQILTESADTIDDQLLGALMGTASRLEEAGQPDQAERLKTLHRHAAGLLMRRKMRDSSEGEG